jgi:hypothetical protein
VRSSSSDTRNWWRGKPRPAAMTETDIVDALMMLYGQDRDWVLAMVALEGWDWATDTAQACPNGMRWRDGDPVL